MLPNSPAAAETPWQKQRYVVGKISAGIMKVRVFAPKIHYLMVRRLSLLEKNSTYRN